MDASHLSRRRRPQVQHLSPSVQQVSPPIQTRGAQTSVRLGFRAFIHRPAAESLTSGPAMAPSLTFGSNKSHFLPFRFLT